MNVQALSDQVLLNHYLSGACLEDVKEKIYTRDIFSVHADG